MSYQYGSDEAVPSFGGGMQATPATQAMVAAEGVVPVYGYEKAEEYAAGPFYFFSPAEIITVSELRLALGPRLEPCRIACLDDETYWENADLLEQVHSDARFKRNPLTGQPDDFKEKEYRVPAGANRNTLLAMYGADGSDAAGLVEIEAWRGKPPRHIGLDLFNRRAWPDSFVGIGKVTAYSYRVPPALQTAAQRGLLSLWRDMAMDAQAFFASAGFLKQANPALQSLYSAALVEILAAYEVYERFANSYLDDQERLIDDKLKFNYDPRDRHLMRVLGRAPKMEAAVRALEGQQRSHETIDRLAGVLTAGAQQKEATEVARKACPRCAESIPEAARYCRFCQLTLTDTAQPVKANDVDEFDKATGGKPKAKA